MALDRKIDLAPICFISNVFCSGFHFKRDDAQHDVIEISAKFYRAPDR